MTYETGADDTAQGAGGGAVRLERANLYRELLVYREKLLKQIRAVDVLLEADGILEIK